MKNKILIGVLVIGIIFCIGASSAERSQTMSVTMYGIASKVYIESDDSPIKCYEDVESEEEDVYICVLKEGSEYTVHVITENILSKPVRIHIDGGIKGAGARLYNVRLLSEKGELKIDEDGFSVFGDLEKDYMMELDVWEECEITFNLKRLSEGYSSFSTRNEIDTPNPNKYFYGPGILIISGACSNDMDCESGYECKNHECVLKVECTKDSQCSYDEKCSNYKCIKLSCGYCEHIENHECVKYECCDDSDCLSGYECKNHECVRKAVTTIPTTQSQGVPIWLIELVIIILLAIIAVLLARRK